MRRRKFAVLAATAITAGCLDTGGSNTLFDNEVEPGNLYSSFEASDGDELQVRIEAGENGANTGVSKGELDGIDEGVNWWGWDVAPDEEMTDTIEIVESDQYTVWINEGTARVTVESAS